MATLSLRRCLSLPLALAAPVLGLACSAGDSPTDSGTDGDGAEMPSTGGSPGLAIEGGLGGGEADETKEPVTILQSLPEGFTSADTTSLETSKGGYLVLGPLADVAAPQGECGNVLRVVLRDFEGAHDDFENAGDWSPYEVLSLIGDSRKPEKTSANGPLHFEEWYVNIEGVNLPFAVDLWLEPVGDMYVYDSTAFFPLEDVGHKDSYLFTTELHTRFEYHGGEDFTFRGDDDVFVFVNGHEAVNLSGVHTAQTGSVALDEVATSFGLDVGGVYTFDLFQAERQPSGSNFRLETTLDFTGCGEVLPVDVIR